MVSLFWVRQSVLKRPPSVISTVSRLMPLPHACACTFKIQEAVILHQGPNGLEHIAEEAVVDLAKHNTTYQWTVGHVANTFLKLGKRSDAEEDWANVDAGKTTLPPPEQKRIVATFSEAHALCSFPELHYYLQVELASC